MSTAERLREYEAEITRLDDRIAGLECQRKLVLGKYDRLQYQTL